VLEKVLRVDRLGVAERKTLPNVQHAIDLGKGLDVDVEPSGKRQASAANMEAKRLGGGLKRVVTRTFYGPLRRCVGTQRPGGRG
jgi:hypothetical protein